MLLARLDSPPHGLLVPELADRLAELVDRAESDDGVGAVVRTGTHPERFAAHADVRWMQEGAARLPARGHRTAAGADHLARLARAGAEHTPLRGMVELNGDLPAYDEDTCARAWRTGGFPTAAAAQGPLSGPVR